MPDPINIIFVANGGELDVIGEAFCSKYNIRLSLKTDDHDEAIRAAGALKKPVVVVRVREPAEVKKLTDALNEKNIIYICICRTAREGFGMLQYGAAEMITRSDADFINEPRALENLLSTKIKSAYAKYNTDASRLIKHEFGAFNKIIAIGSSTGGTETVLEILKDLPADAPPVLIVQHMPPVFTRLYAERLHGICKMSVWEAHNGDTLKRGLALLAPGDLQMTLEAKDGGYRVRCSPGEKESGHCPSVDVLFRSVAAVGAKAVGVILTGMGKDGALGLLEMRRNGAMTFGQDEESCVVYGMPMEAYEIGAVAKQLPAGEMARAIMECL